MIPCNFFQGPLSGSTLGAVHMAVVKAKNSPCPRELSVKSYDEREQVKI